jgi:hypothetical protein
MRLLLTVLASALVFPAFATDDSVVILGLRISEATALEEECLGVRVNDAVVDAVAASLGVAFDEKAIASLKSVSDDLAARIRSGGQEGQICAAALALYGKGGAFANGLLQER